MDNSSSEAVIFEKSILITKELIEETVKKAAGNNNVDILDFTCKAGTNKGDNYTSIITAVKVKARVGGSDEIKTYDFILKEFPSDPARSKYMEYANIFEKETAVYTILLPALVDVQRQFGINKPVSVEAPKLYPSKEKKFLIFENLVPLGYKMANKYTGLDYDHCSLVIKELAKFHGLSYALKCRTSKPLDEEYPALVETMFEGKLEELFSPFFESTYNMAIKAVEVADAPLAAKMKTRVGNVYQTCKDIRYNSEGLEFASHGDCWVNNMLFKYEKRGDKELPVGIKLLDFQMVRIGSPTLDLSYFIYTSTTYDLRRTRLSDLLKLYHDTFVNTIHSMGLDCPEFTLQRLSDKFDKDRLFGYFFACLALPFMMARPEESFDMEALPDVEESQMAEEFANQMEESLAKMTDNHYFQNRLRGIALDIEEAGLI